MSDYINIPSVELVPEVSQETQEEQAVQQYLETLEKEPDEKMKVETPEQKVESEIQKQFPL
jgi:hypothetical protein